jgi:hypothetical protein
VTIDGPLRLEPFKAVLIDGVNIALARPLYGRFVHEDLIACIRFFEEKGLKTYTILDDNDCGRDIFYFLTRLHGYTRVWLCTEADPIILEIAKRVNYSIVLSCDDFGQYQWRYGLVIFDPRRIFTFECAGAPGSGRIRPHIIHEKDLMQLETEQIILLNLGTLLDILLMMPEKSTHYAREFYKDICQLLEQQKRKRAFKVALDFAEVLINACEGSRLDFIKKLHVARQIRSVKNLSQSDRQEIKVILQQLFTLLRHLDKERMLPTADMKKYLYSLEATLSNVY